MQKTKKKPARLYVYYHNMGGLRTKLTNIHFLLQQSVYDIIVFSETWFSADILDSEVCPTKYNIFRADRNSNTSPLSRGGGVAIMVKSELTSSVVSTQYDTVEQLFVLVEGAFKFIVGAVYLPPNSGEGDYASHGLAVEEVSLLYPDTKIFVCGDYNIPNAFWDEERFIMSTNSDKYAALNDSLNFVNLIQVNRVSNKRSKYLDLIFTNEISTKVVVASDPLQDDTLHHLGLQFTVARSDESVVNVAHDEDQFDFDKGNYMGLNNFLASCDWNFDNMDIDQAVSKFYQQLYEGLYRFIPLRREKGSRYPSWFNGELIGLVNAKRRAHRNYITSSNPRDYQYFSYLRNHCKKLSKSLYHSYLYNIENRIHHNPRSFWSYLNSKRKVNALPVNMDFRGARVCGGDAIVGLFADFFSEVYCDELIVPHAFTYENNINLSSCQFGVGEVYEVIRNIKPKKSSGPDGVPEYILQKCINTLSLPICKLFNRSLLLGRFPCIWKSSFVVPIFKSGSRSSVENYRGIAIQSAIPKLLDNLLCNFLSWNCKSILINEQHGFRRGRSTITNLVLYSNDILKCFESGMQVDSVYTDFSKAFDKVNLNLLVAKLSALGISGSLLSWIRQFLYGRTQIVKYKNFRSREFGVSSGVPQGSHLGPLLFNLFINDLGTALDCRFLLFADDMKIYSPIRDVADSFHLQDQLDKFFEWTALNCLALNISKCKTITFSRSKISFNFHYSINGSILARVGSVDDLGLRLDNQLNFREHIHGITAKSYRNLGFVYRNSYGFSPETLKLLFCSLVRSGLEYGSCVWSPIYRCHVDSIERIQNKFLRVLDYRSGGHFNGDTSRIRKYFHLDTLEKRRTCSDVCFLFKLLDGTVDCAEVLNLVGFNVPIRTTRNTHLFRISTHRTNYTLNSFPTRTLKFVNSHLNSVDFFSVSFFSFKTEVLAGLRNLL